MRKNFLRKSTVIELLKQGNNICYNWFTAEILVEDKEQKALGEVRFDIFLKLRKELNLKQQQTDRQYFEVYSI